MCCCGHRPADAHRHAGAQRAAGGCRRLCGADERLISDDPAMRVMLAPSARLRLTTSARQRAVAGHSPVCAGFGGRRCRRPLPSLSPRPTRALKSDGPRRASRGRDAASGCCASPPNFESACSTWRRVAGRVALGQAVSGRHAAPQAHAERRHRALDSSRSRARRQRRSGRAERAGRGAALLGEAQQLLAQRLAELDEFDWQLDRSRASALRRGAGLPHAAVRRRLAGQPRMVRDLGRSLGKQVRLEIVGETTQVDRDILEKLDAPLEPSAAQRRRPRHRIARQRVAAASRPRA